MGYLDFAVPSFFGESTAPETAGYLLNAPQSGVLAPQQGTSWDIPYVAETPWYQPPGLSTGGVIDLANRSNNTWWGLDQSKITASLSDVLGSVLQAGAKTAVQAAAGSINSAANGKPSGLQSLAANFRSTATGVQINAGAQAFSFQNFVSNPLVWFGTVVVVILFFVLKR
jgi:hypothetical protein